MIRKVEIAELKPGMYLCGLEKKSGETLYFTNNIRIRNTGDIEKLASGNRAAYIDVAVDRAARPSPNPLLSGANLEAPHAVSSPPASENSEIIRPKDSPQGDDRPGASAVDPIPIEEALVIEYAEVMEPVQAPPAEPEKLACVETAIKKRHYGDSSGNAPGPSSEEKTAAGAVKGKAPARRPVIKSVDIVDNVDFKAELKNAKNVRSEALDLAKSCMLAIRSGKEIDTEKVGSTVSKMVDSIFSNQHALTSLSRLKSFDNYTFTHSINVCTLSISMGRSIGLNREEILELGIGTILHDVGKMLVPESILNKPGRLTDEEFDVIKSHTTLGADILQKTRGISDDAIYVALQHQEKFDGTGYPHKIAGEEIHLYARIAAVADVYDAMTSKRVYKAGMPPDEALRHIYALRALHFEGALVERLISNLGIYPIGTLVKINTGETALVRMANHRSPTQPLVLMLYDGDKRPFPKPFEINLEDDEGRCIVASLNTENMENIIDTLIT